MRACSSFVLGAKYCDRISKFKGIAIGYVQYISGCNQVLLQPQQKKYGTIIESVWLDEQRLERISTSEIQIDNTKTPGFDKPAPKR